MPFLYWCPARGLAVPPACADLRRAGAACRQRVGWSAQRLERGAHLGGEQVRLLPGGEVAAFAELVAVDEVAGVNGAA
jgi:hypothetical protein